MSAVLPSASYSITVRLSITQSTPGCSAAWPWPSAMPGGILGAVDLVESGARRDPCDMTIKARDQRTRPDRSSTPPQDPLAGVRIVNISDRTFLMHLGGKIEIHNKAPIRTRDDLSMAYTPGVARVCLATRDDPQRAFALTIKQNTVAVVTDGTAVMGLGDIGPEAALPVMEGKAMLFKEFAGVTQTPISFSRIKKTITHRSLRLSAIISTSTIAGSRQNLFLANPTAEFVEASSRTTCKARWTSALTIV